MYAKKYVFRELILAYRFFLVGLIATATHMFLIWRLISKGELNVYFANFYAFLIAFLISFSGHYYWTFKIRPKFISTLVKMLSVSISVYFLNTIILTFLVNFFLLPELSAALTAAFICPLLSFFALRLCVFNKN